MHIDTLVENSILWFFRVLHIKLKENQLNLIHQFVKFGIVGVSNTIISYLIYTGVLILLKIFKLLPDYDYFIALFLSFVLSVLWSFYWNNKFVFNKNERNSGLLYALLKTYASYAFSGLFLNAIMLWVLIDLFKISDFIAPIITLLVTVPINFILNKFWAFK